MQIDFILLTNSKSDIYSIIRSYALFIIIIVSNSFDKTPGDCPSKLSVCLEVFYLFVLFFVDPLVKCF